MPRGKYARRGIKRGPYKRRTTAMRAPMKITKSLRPKTKQPHFHVRFETTDRTIDLAGTTQFVASVNTYQLAYLQNYAELAALYDNFKITKVVHYVNWSPFAYSAGMNDNDKSPELVAPLLMYYRDHDDDSTFTLSDMKQIGSVKQFRIRPGKQYKIAVNPSILTEAFRTGVTAAYMPKFGQKIDMATPDVKHYGLKIGVSKAPIGLGQINIRTKYYVTCFNTR